MERINNEALRASDDAAQAAGTGAPRVTLANIEARIVGENYFTAGDAAIALGQPNHTSLHLLTLCVLILDNGFTVTGESACASPENFNAQFGRELARKHAVEKVWTLEAYLLRERLHAATRAGEALSASAG